MNKLLSYLKDRKMIYIFSFVFIGIFYLILYLYHALIDAIHYATILCLAILFIYFIIDFIMYYKKTSQLDYILHLDDVSIADLPAFSSLLEKQYQTLITKVNELHILLQNQNEQHYHETIDYFTLWVHQIKTPISALRLLIQSQDCSQNDLMVQVLKIEQYVDMVLNYMKLDHMSSDLSLKHYQLGDIVNEVIKKQAIFFIQKKLQFLLDPIDCMILSDEKWIFFVIEQILSNAIKYTKEGLIHIYVENETLYIEDNGIGMKAEDLPRVFEKGFTGYNGRLDKKASGLGLYLCKTILDNLGHKIHMSSIQGKGTVVSIDFHVEKRQFE